MSSRSRLSRSTGLSQSTSSVSSPSSNTTTRAGLFASRLARRSTAFGKSRIPTTASAHKPFSASGSEETTSNELEVERRTIRRYKVGDLVLVCNLQTRWANFVNKHGFPPGEGETLEERRGPYIYVLCQVKKVHFEEIAAYYTVTRKDTGVDQRADAKYMEPIRTVRGEHAAANAATNDPSNSVDHIRGADNEDADGDVAFDNKCLACMYSAVLIVLLPFFSLYDGIRFLGKKYIKPCWIAMMVFVKHHCRLMLNGISPYACRIRLTCVNFIVVCSTWYMFIDQARLAFFPPAADFGVAVANLVVWIILVLELAFEVFIRPDGYHSLIVSEKAFSPTTVRFISAFHLFIEFITLMLFIPEFYCLLSDTVACDDRIPFSFYNAALIGVIGPYRSDVFFGHAYMALIRLRVFGLVRHWKNMWIANTFINRKWTAKQGGVLSNIVPYNPRGSTERKSLLPKKHFDPDVVEQKKREAALTNASTIGTALMVTNSYRALVILWFIVGVFPIIFSILTTLYNPAALNMTNQMQGTNLVASDNLNETCGYLRDSTWVWAAGMFSVSSFRNSEPFLLTLDILPLRCPFQYKSHESAMYCDLYEQSLTPKQKSGSFAYLLQLCRVWSSVNGATVDEVADSTGKRAGSIVQHTITNLANFTNYTAGETVETEFSVTATYDETATIRFAYVLVIVLGSRCSLKLPIILFTHSLSPACLIVSDRYHPYCYNYAC